MNNLFISSDAASTLLSGMCIADASVNVFNIKKEQCYEST